MLFFGVKCLLFCQLLSVVKRYYVAFTIYCSEVLKYSLIFKGYFITTNRNRLLIFPQMLLLRQVLLKIGPNRRVLKFSLFIKLLKMLKYFNF